jgi:hypothetical protein
MDTLQPANILASTIESLASNFRKGFGHGLEPDYTHVKTNLENLVRKLGGQIQTRPDPYHPNTSLLVEKPGKFTIFLSQYTSPLRDNFLIAHEIGHYLLHYCFPKKNTEIHFNKVGKGKIEREANTFAAGLLMPALPFSTSLYYNKGFIERVALQFGVSSDIAQKRAESLSLLPMPR